MAELRAAGCSTSRATKEALAEPLALARAAAQPGFEAVYETLLRGPAAGPFLTLIRFPPCQENARREELGRLCAASGASWPPRLSRAAAAVRAPRLDLPDDCGVPCRPTAVFVRFAPAYRVFDFKAAIGVPAHPGVLGPPACLGGWSS